jgi:N-methylhydantoinase A/oxoprolinase/acetone carboxylase beta subunit
MEVVLGIDTGGTFTDGVLLDYASRQVLATAKAPTTRHDLTVGILNAIDALPPTGAGRIRLVSISTTLATNAIAEAKGRRVGLFLIGYDADLVQRFNFGPRFATPRYYFFGGGHDLFGQEQAPLDVEGLARQAGDLAAAGDVDAFAVSAYFSPHNPQHEEQACQAIQQAAPGVPVVLGHHLATKLNSIERATTAALNAALVPVLHDFVAAVRGAMQARGISAPLMIVRGDGTLMSADAAEQAAIETIHSGPAASAIGGRFLSGCDRALVVDIGGTTTDLAVIDRGQVTVEPEGTTVAGYRTAVRAANIRSFGLGGDSWLTLDREEQLRVGPGRVTPLAYLAGQHAHVRDELLALAARSPTEALLDGLEYWFQLRPLPATADARVRELGHVLRDGPRPLRVVLKALGLAHPLQFAGHHLLEREVIGRAALTPTDLLHAQGRYAPWDTAAATAAATVFARMRGWSVDELAARVFGTMTDTIVAEIVQFLTGRRLPARDFHSQRHDLGLWFLDQSLAPAHPYLEPRLRLKMPLIGIGAPAGIFLPAVAEALGTDLVLPAHYAVANAVGAVAAGVVAHCEAVVYARLRDLSPAGYVAQVGEVRRTFAERAEALSFARAEAARQAEAEALRQGAVRPQTRVDEVMNGLDEHRLRAQSVGNPALSGDGGQEAHRR